MIYPLIDLPRKDAVTVDGRQRVVEVRGDLAEKDPGPGIRPLLRLTTRPQIQVLVATRARTPLQPHRRPGRT